MIVTIANAKGGVAKTTSAIYLAAAYARRFEEGATVLDADPQSSASLWRDMAEENGGWPAGTDVMPANLSTLQRLARAGHGGFAVVDAPPQGRLFEESVKAADFVVVPTSDSPIDLQQAWATMNAIPDGKPGAVLIVRAEPRTRSVSGMADVFRSDQTGEWSKTSVSMRPETRRRLKTYAAAHDMRIQEVIDLALEAYLA
ncbi:Chromosome partitioning protein parA [Bifidobacterium longum subsp. longum]|uniref:Chromosome partitioning protein parA n=1 Tax=Bifidobacterium longum subsp. longum TaxID=1679 RepID=A0A4R0UP36_BIFLL|nr:ParA family protein [Bifidobacterium longum]TCF39400.1 Chromosome partitioning protein parA [Bifidobacterium longum subsp. longum]